MAMASLRRRTAQLEAALERATAVGAALRDVGTAIGTTLDLDELLATILERSRAILRADRATLYLRDGGRLVSRVTIGEDARTIEMPLGHGIAGTVAKTGRPIRIADAYRDRRFDRRWDRLTGYRTRSILAVPLKRPEGEIIGVLQALNRQGPDGAPAEFDRLDTELLTALGFQATVAIEKSRLFRTLVGNNAQLVETTAQLGRSVRELQFLYDLQAEMARAVTLEELARAVVLTTARLCDARAGGLLVSGEAGQHTLLLTRLAAPTQVRRVILPSGEGLVGRALSRGEAVLALGARAIGDSRRVRAALELVPRSALALPICREADRPCGALVLYDIARTGAVLAEPGASLPKLLAAGVSAHLHLLRAREDRERRDRLTTIGQLLSGVLHDLRTPLTVIGGHVELMTQADSRTIRLQHAGEIAEQFAVIDAMQRDLLAYARGQTSVLRRKVALSRLGEELTRVFARDLELAGVRLVTQIDAQAIAQLDETKIARALRNLMRNAIDAMTGRGGTLTLGMALEDAELVLRVADTGPGIPKSVRARLFEPFVTMGKTSGTGLGLSIVKRIVDEHEGAIAVTSGRRGTCFTIRLPGAVGPASQRRGSQRS